MVNFSAQLTMSMRPLFAYGLTVKPYRKTLGWPGKRPESVRGNHVISFSQTRRVFSTRVGERQPQSKFDFVWFVDFVMSERMQILAEQQPCDDPLSWS